MCVRCLVPDEVGAPRETAHALQTFVWLLARVHSLVDDEVRLLAKALLTGPALVGLLPRVNSFMHDEG